MGGKKSPVDVRIHIATNRNLEEMVEIGNSGKTCFYRLNVYQYLFLLSRERQEILNFTQYFLELYNVKLRKSIKGFSYEVENTLLNYDWRGKCKGTPNAMNMQ